MTRIVQTTQRGWATVTEVPDVVRKRLVENIPGVSDLGGAVKIPLSAWDLPEVTAFIPELMHATPCTALVDGWQPTRPLLPHQARAVTTLLGMLATTSGAILADEMGLGKTQTAITVARQIIVPSKPLRLVVGPKYLREVWAAELLACGAITDARELVMLEGRDIYGESSGWRWDGKWYFLHYDILIDWIGRLHHVPFGVVIFDEAHVARSAKTKRGEAAAAIAGVIPFRLLLTGTPLVNKTSELWNLLSMATGPRSWGSEFNWRLRYAGTMSGGYGYVDTIPTNVDELRDRMHHCYLRREIAVLGDVMPPLSRQSIVIDIDEEARKRHDSTLAASGYTAAGIVSMFQTGAVDKRVFELLHQLQNVTTRAKLATTAEYVRGLVDAGDDVVIFVTERATARALANKIGKLQHEKRTFEVTGAMSTEQRATTISVFQEGGGVIVATYGSIGMGVTLTRARAVVLHDMPWTFAAALQAEKRAHRIGSKKSVRSYWMLAQDSVDTLVARVLIAKAGTIATTLDVTDAAKAAIDTGLADIAGSSDDAFQKNLDEWLGRVA